MILSTSRRFCVFAPKTRWVDFRGTGELLNQGSPSIVYWGVSAYPIRSSQLFITAWKRTNCFRRVWNSKSRTSSIQWRKWRRLPRKTRCQPRKECILRIWMSGLVCWRFWHLLIQHCSGPWALHRWTPRLGTWNIAWGKLVVLEASIPTVKLDGDMRLLLKPRSGNMSWIRITFFVG